VHTINKVTSFNSLIYKINLTSKYVLSGTPCNYFVRLYCDDVGILGLVREMCVSCGTICSIPGSAPWFRAGVLSMPNLQ
jgi:hypothetical protein